MHRNSWNSSVHVPTTFDDHPHCCGQSNEHEVVPFTNNRTMNTWRKDSDVFEPIHFDMMDKGNTYLVQAKLPGMTKNDVTLNVEGNDITIKGETSNELVNTEPESGYHHEIRNYVFFSRTIQFPENTDMKSVSATIDQGCLRVKAHKLEEGTSKKLSSKDLRNQVKIM